jgi:benzoyl-CoA 2,3-epoxidase subunit B
LEGIKRVEVYEDGRLTEKEISPRLAINQTVREAYTDDCQKAVDRWNRHLEGSGFKLTLPSVRFHRNVGTYAGACFDPAGNLLSEAEFERREHEFLPSASDREYVHSLMARPVLEAGHFANWIAPPVRGIDGKPMNFEYVRYNEEA